MSLKKGIIVISCVSVFTLAQELSLLDSQDLNISRFKNPFFKNPTNPQFKVEALLNDSVKIGSKWYKKGDYIKDSKIIDINKNNIILMKDNEDIVIDTKRSSHKILIN